MYKEIENSELTGNEEVKKPKEILAPGSFNSNAIKEVQSFLNSEGYTDSKGEYLAVDGIYGANTANAVMKYQRANNLSVDGIVGDETWNSMYNKKKEKKGSDTFVESLDTKSGGFSLDVIQNNREKQKEIGITPLGKIDEQIKQGLLPTLKPEIYSGSFGETPSYMEAFEETEKEAKKLEIPKAAKDEETFPGWGKNITETKVDKEELVTKEQLTQLGWKNVDDDMIKELNSVLRKYHIVTKEDLCHFLSQVSAESECGTALVEKHNGTPEVYFSDVSGGDKYRGAGYIQLTHDYTYRDFANYVGDPDIFNKGFSYVAENYLWEAAAWFWAVYKNNFGLHRKAKEGASVEVITKIVNGGDNGLEKRKKYYNLAKSIFMGE